MAINMTFTDFVTPVPADWLNNVNTIVNNITPNVIVSSIAGLRLVSSVLIHSVQVTGYYSSGDGGGGFYQYNASDTTSADNGGTIIVASNGARWYLIYQDELSVSQFGAKGDGVADDTVALQNAITFSGRTKLSFGAKTYLYSTLTLPSNGAYIEGQGPFATQLLTLSPTGGISAPGVGVIQITDLGFGVAPGVTFTGNGPFIAITGASSDHLIRRCLFNGGFGHIQLTNANIYQIEDNYFVSASTYHIQVENILAPDAGDSTVSGNVFDPANTTCACISQSSSGGLRVINNKFLSGAYHYLGQFSTNPNPTSILLIDNNSSEHAFNANFALNSSSNTSFSQIIISNNQITVDPGPGATGVLIQDPGYAWIDHIRIAGNTFAMGGLAGQFAIQVNRATRLHLGTNAIVGNNVEQGIQIGSGVTSGHIEFQSMFNLANYWGGGGLANVTFSGPRKENGSFAGSTTGAYGALFASGAVTVTFAQPYAVAPAVQLTPLTGNGVVGAILSSVTTTGFTAIILGVTNTTTVQAYWVALG